MTKYNPFDFLTSISETKQNLIREADQPDMVENQYVPFVVNKGLSYHIDSILHANRMNMFHYLPKAAQYEYYLNTISRKKRRAKWHKPIDRENLALVREYFQCNEKVGKQYLEYLTDKQIETIKIKLLEGGTNNGRNSK